MRTTNRKLEALAAVVADADLDPWGFATTGELLSAVKASGTPLSELSAGTVRPLPAGDPDVWRILRRSELRRSFGLKAKSCLRDDDRYGCACGEVVFDGIDDADAIALGALSRDERRRELLRRSKPHHIRPPRPRREPRRPRPQPPQQLDQEAEPEPQSPAESPVENGRDRAPEILAEKAPTATPVRRRERQPVDPRSWAAWKQSRSPSLAGLMHRKF